jgi:predicted CXXCH cytochrome family protein
VKVVTLLAVLVVVALIAFRLTQYEHAPLYSTAAQNFAAAGYAGSARCKGCHAAESAAWQRSHHAQSMQPATDQTMPAAFNDITVSSASGPVKLLRQEDGSHVAVMAGFDGKPARFPIAYTFGVDPLQEYLVNAPGGRLQVLPVARDTRPQQQGGQRWFSLYPNDHFSPGDPLHWTGRDQNWNFMCADCHSTGVRRDYDSGTDTYATTFSEVNVACEACHGPASRHIELMRKHGPASESGLTVSLHAARAVQWGLWTEDQRIASPRGDVQAATAQSAVCFPCHARRQSLTRAAAPGSAFLDNYLPQFIESGVYHADGQIDAEDFEFGSFVQSRMHAKGVTCTNCHEAHTLQLRAHGNALCTQCHRSAVYDQPTHHHHPATSAGGQCINCHMPEKTYMILHSRRDHSFRVPRPDLSVTLGIPNTCNQCHQDRKATWAVAAIERWTRRKSPDTDTHFATAMRDSWTGANATAALLNPTGAMPPLPAFIKASLLAQFGAQLQPLPQPALQMLASAAADPDPLVRLGVARGLAGLSAEDAIRLGAPLLQDSTRAVRVETARALAGASNEQLGPTAAARLQAAVDELIAAEQASAERPESHVNLAEVFVRLGRDDEAYRELDAALHLDKDFVPALVNLADLDRSRGREKEAEQRLRQAMAAAPLAAAPVHALGLLEVSRSRPEQALPLLAKSSQLDPRNARYAYVYAIALAESGQPSQAGRVVAEARRRLPRDVSLLELEEQLSAGQPGDQR